MNTYSTSKGERIKKSIIDSRVRNAKKWKLDIMMEDCGYLFCEDCGTSNGILDCSHDISVKECQETSRTEMSWDVENITIRCRKCHNIHDKSY